MGNYSKAALAAYTMIVERSHTPHDAWNEAIASVTASPSARKKGCPRATFLALADNGYLKGVNANASVQNHGVLRTRAIRAAEFILSHPFATYSDLASFLSYADRQGSYEMVIDLAKRGCLQRKIL